MRGFRVVCVAAIGVCALLAVAGSTARATVPGTTKDWAIDVPAGWQEDVEIPKAARDKLLAKQFKPRQFELRLWYSDPGAGTLMLGWFAMSLSADIRREIDDVDRALLQSFTKSAVPPDHSQQVAGSMVIRELRFDKFEALRAPARVVRRYQPAEDGIHGLFILCATAPDFAICDKALDSVQFIVANPVSLDDRSGSPAYKLGYSLGSLLIVVVPVWLLYRLYRRRNRDATSLRVTGAAPPGSPPGPGAAADDR